MLALDGLAKLAEECGELLQVVGKQIAYFDTDVHPDGAGPLSVRMEDEMADVMAALAVVIELRDLDKYRIKERTERKIDLFLAWAKEGQP